RNICARCPYKEKCTESKDCQKVVTRHVWEEYMEMAEDIRHTPEGKELYSLRSQTIERVFADAKEKQNMRYTQYKGKAKVRMQVLMTFACQNLKKLAKWKRINGMLPPFLYDFLQFLSFRQKFTCLN
ncbi:MAG: transposase, partial [Oscillospiraceae bacterium]